ncbi:dna-directed rna polymerase iii subunit rpc7 [Pyrenophora tritici-repentis]|nr:dna-directed rna polymerase iii protein [Pyrenophora tritici-repentis]KAI0582732.1 dna-directed rna polymerase iii subunit rpc7 [Pyrenophora tritici-repentis]KAI0584439.1 dna-directed rna polymerase iii subunit rpc7 [Pyrenophora tritici-repentis]KAI0606884.1 dna-directed rna polymerase iii subunit rpc7 [Pyrenophora tritici-repentis]KAI0625959.1 dna-directed rna polymerase iii subunit rpc7 [Pyrenophora tritici-repentis]
MPPARGGRGGRGGGRGGAFNPVRGTVTIAGTELNWDLSGLEIQKGPAERFPDRPPPQAPPPTDDEADMVRHHLSFRDRVHEGPFYTLLNDGMKDGLKRKASEPAPTEATLFDPFTGNQTYSAKYLKVRRRLPKLDERPYVVDLFPAELRSLLDGTHTDGNPTKKRRTLGGTQVNPLSEIERMIKSAEDKNTEAKAPVGEDDNYSAASTDSEESDDDYNAEQYFDNGEDDDIDDGDPYQNTYDE